MSGFVDDNTAQHIGRFFGAQFIVAGAFESFGDAFIFRVRVIEVETAVIRGTHTETVSRDRLVRYLLGGVDLGFISNMANVEGYYSIVPFVHYAFFLPFDDLPIPFTRGGWHIGAGVGFIIEEHRFAHFAIQRRDFIADFVTGFNVGNRLDISYTLRTDFSTLMQKVSIGFTHRFQ